MHNIKLLFAYLEFIMHMQNQLKVSSFIGTKVGFSNDMPFFSYAHAIMSEILSPLLVVVCKQYRSLAFCLQSTPLKPVSLIR